MEENDPPNVVGNRLIAGEKDVTEATAVLLCVLHVDLLQAFGHGTCTEEQSLGYTHTFTAASVCNAVITEADLLIHLQPVFPFLEQQFSEQCQRAPSSALEIGMDTDGSSWGGKKKGKDY